MNVNDANERLDAVERTRVYHERIGRPEAPYSLGYRHALEQFGVRALIADRDAFESELLAVDALVADSNQPTRYLRIAEAVATAWTDPDPDAAVTYENGTVGAIAMTASHDAPSAEGLSGSRLRHD